MPGDAKRTGDRLRRLHLVQVPLAVLNRQRVQIESLRLDDRRGGVRIQSATQ
jgi:hypothetical protein